MASQATDLQLPPYPDAVSSLAFHPSDPDLLLSGTWDSSIYLHDLKFASTVQKFPIKGAVLDVAWGPQSTILAGGLGKEVLKIERATKQSTSLKRHEDAVKCIEYSEELNAVIAASWDQTLSVTSLSSTPSTSLTVPLPAKPYSMALTQSKLVVAMGGRAVWIWDVAKLGSALQKDEASRTEDDVEPEQKRESSLKFMTRAVRSMPNDQGYATTSIEGRVAVEFFDPSAEAQAKKYAFKCHRQVLDGVDTVYPVQGLAFNRVHGTFATGGGDATVSLWDPFAKKRLRQFPKYPSPVSALEFNADGTKLAVAFSEADDWGAQTGGPQSANGNGVIIRTCGDECKPKAKA